MKKDIEQISKSIDQISKSIDQIGEELESIKHKNCADLIKDNLASLNDELKVVMSNSNDDDHFNDTVLSIDEYQLTSICLSYGGPSSYLEVKHRGSDIISVIYRYSDWFDTATLPVFDFEPAYEYARKVIEIRE